MRTDDLDYPLPDSAVATVPAEPRDSARLLIDRGDRVEHGLVSELVTRELVRPGDVLVVNDTRVLPARVRFRRSSGGSGEVLLLAPLHDGWWEALVRPSAKLRPGTTVAIADDFEIEFGEDLGDGRRMVRPVAADGLDAALQRHGELPLPPYLGATTLDDPERYQTTYSRRAASAAAPTAGLHLTHELLASVQAAGVILARVELVIGLGTFRPITVDDVEDHVMHHESYAVAPEVWEQIRNADRVLAVGTTVVRTLESVAATGELSGSTDLFIRPGFPWQVIDVLMTSFHLPRSSLLAMIEAFVGPRWRELYAVALHDGYRFLSLGDASWLTRSAVR